MLELLSKYALCALLVLGSGALGSAQAPSWEDLSENLFRSVEDFREGPNALMNGIGALGVDPGSGDLYVFVQLNGLYRSRDQGETFQRIDDGRMTGRMMGGSNMRFDPSHPGRAVFFFIKAQEEPGGGALTLDGGETLRFFQIPDIDGFTSGAVDWSSPNPEVIVARQHHGHENPLWHSSDAGQTWTNLPVNGWQPGLVTPEIFLTGAGSYKNDKPGILRSTDGGKSWNTVSDARALSLNPEVVGEKIFWITEEGLLVSANGGASWELTAENLPKPFAGPFPGQTTNELLIVTTEGFYMSRDSGASWSSLFPDESLEAQMVNFNGKIGSIQSQSYGWDSKNKYLYATRRNGELMRRTIPE